MINQDQEKETLTFFDEMLNKFIQRDLVSKAFVLSQFGEEPKWLQLYMDINRSFGENQKNKLHLSDLLAIAERNGCSESDLLAFLSICSHPKKGFIKARFVSGNGTEVSERDIQSNLKNFKKRKSMDESDWNSWLEGIEVFWTLNEMEVH